MLGVVKDVTPVPLVNIDPPVAAEYQSIVAPAGAVAEIVAVPEPQTFAPIGTVGAAGVVLIVAVTAVLTADKQPVVVFLTCA